MLNSVKSSYIESSYITKALAVTATLAMMNTVREFLREKILANELVAIIGR